VLIRDARPLRLHRIAADDRSVGFPPHHPPMNTFLGVPILLRGIAYGNLYLTTRAIRSQGRPLGSGSSSSTAESESS
jgi:hypothetical protein